ncbi:hypothetical protein PQX77_005082 [Marasmius sp. AFHP31]|nr:hypothetical protein PQX77_005082 [Marasmius sp. AFHP31]
MFNFFRNARRFTITGGTFSSVQGDQYNRTTINRTTPAGRRLHIEGSWEEEAEYQKVRLPLRDLWILDADEQMATTQRTNVLLRSINGNDENSKFTVIVYTGREALEVWKRDFKWYSQTLGSRHAHLFALERSQIPRLIFTGELLPVTHILDCVGYWAKIYLESLTAQFQCAGNEIWLDPQQGVLCQGPEGLDCDLASDFYYFEYHDENYPMGCEFLEEDVSLRFFAGCRSRDLDRAIVEGLSFPPHRKEINVPMDDANILTSTKRIIPIVSRYSLLSGTNCFYERQVLGDGATRLTLKGATEKIDLWITWEEEVAPWLAQASSIEDARGSLLGDDLTQYNVLVPCLELTGSLSQAEPEAARRREHPRPIYLFIRLVSPYPSHLSSGPNTSLHFWSFDETGQIPLSAGVCHCFGLPVELMLSGHHTYYTYSNETYQLVRQYQLARGFDLGTADFAKYLGHPLYEIEGTTFRGSESGRVVKSSFRREKLEPDEVVIEITHSGLCGTDIHYLEQDMVLGHEGVGIAVEVGAGCTRVKKGDRVGWGYPQSTCMQCDQCTSGHDQWCKEARMYGEADFDQGSFGTLAIRKEQWVFQIPDTMNSEHAAPLMCGGATVFTPLIEHVRPIDRVGVVGIGGLGHLAIQFAAKMGCDVVVFSGTDSKRDEAMKLGANEFYATKGVEDYSTLGLKKPLNHLLITSSVAPERLDTYYSILDQRAKIFPLTVTSGNITTAQQPTTLTGVQVVGSKIASRYMQSKILDFAARNEVFPILELFPLNEEGANEAIKKLQEGNVRYRAVLAK